MTVIDAYLDELDEAQRAALERVRKLGHKYIPEAEETIGYGMPVLKYKGKYVLGFAAFKDHLSIFPGALPDKVAKDLSQYKVSKGTIQFTIDLPIPETAIKELIITRLKNIAEGITWR